MCAHSINNSSTFALCTVYFERSQFGPCGRRQLKIRRSKEKSVEEKKREEKGAALMFRTKSKKAGDDLKSTSTACKSQAPSLSRLGSLLTTGWKKKLFSFAAVSGRKKYTKQQGNKQGKQVEETPTPTTTTTTTTTTIDSVDAAATEINTSQLSRAVAHITLHDYRRHDDGNAEQGLRDDNMLSFNFRGTRKDLAFTLNELKKYANFTTDDHNDANHESGRIQSRLMNVDKEKHLLLFNTDPISTPSSTYANEWLRDGSFNSSFRSEDVYFSSATITDKYDLANQMKEDSSEEGVATTTACFNILDYNCFGVSRNAKKSKAESPDNDVEGDSAYEHNNIFFPRVATAADGDLTRSQRRSSQVHFKDEECGACGFLCIEPYFEETES